MIHFSLPFLQANLGVGKYEFIIIHFSLPFLQAVYFLQASGMMKRLTAFVFHLSLGKNMGTAFSRSAGKWIIINSYSQYTCWIWGRK